MATSVFTPDTWALDSVAGVGTDKPVMGLAANGDVFLLIRSSVSWTLYKYDSAGIAVAGFTPYVVPDSAAADTYSMAVMNGSVVVVRRGVAAYMLNASTGALITTPTGPGGSYYPLFTFPYDASGAFIVFAQGTAPRGWAGLFGDGSTSALFSITDTLRIQYGVGLASGDYCLGVASTSSPFAVNTKWYSGTDLMGETGPLTATYNQQYVRYDGQGNAGAGWVYVVRNDGSGYRRLNIGTGLEDPTWWARNELTYFTAEPGDSVLFGDHGAREIYRVGATGLETEVLNDPTQSVYPPLQVLSLDYDLGPVYMVHEVNSDVALLPKFSAGQPVPTCFWTNLVSSTQVCA